MFTVDQLIENLKKNQRFWIVFTGDSWTSAEWVHPNWREIVEYFLKMELMEGEDWKTPSWGVRTFNFAYDGATTQDILEKIDDIKLVNPDLVISFMGGNDSVFDIPVEESVDNIKKISQNIAMPLVWCTGLTMAAPKENERYYPYVQAILNLPQNKDFQVLDTFSLSQDFPLERIFTFKATKDNLLAGQKQGDLDLQHPNQLGNAYIAQVVLGKVFGIEIDPERYLKDVSAGLMYPTYES